MPSHKKSQKVGPGKTKPLRVPMKRTTRSATGIVTPRFATWFDQTGGRRTPIGYGALKPNGGGGTMAWRFLRVKDFMDINTNAVATLPPGIAAARLQYPGKHFKAGHLLNAAFGGPGNLSKNLTILSASGNSRHKAFDNKIKEAFRQLKKSYEVLCRMGLPPDEAVLSIMIRVRTEGEWGPTLPDLNICETLRCKASLWGRGAVNTSIANLPNPATVAQIAEYNGYVNRALVAINTALKAVPNP